MICRQRIKLPEIGNALKTYLLISYHSNFVSLTGWMVNNLFIAFIHISINSFHVFIHCWFWFHANISTTQKVGKGKIWTFSFTKMKHKICTHTQCKQRYEPTWEYEILIQICTCSENEDKKKKKGWQWNIPNAFKWYLRWSSTIYRNGIRWSGIFILYTPLHPPSVHRLPDRYNKADTFTLYVMIIIIIILLEPGRGLES